MATNLDPRCLVILKRLHNTPNNIHSNPRHTNTPTPHTQINTITQAYSRINDNIAKGKPTSLQDMKKDLPHIPHKILEELTKCTQTIKGYYPHIQNTNTNPPPLTTTTSHNHQAMTLKVLTWNTGCINSSLPGIQELAQALPITPHIILIQETKLQKLKSTTYIDRQLPNYKIIYNNSNNLTNTPNRFAGPTTTRGGILAMIPKDIYTNENITKIPTPSSISHYLQIILINNKPITPILLLNMYMPSHPQDTHLIQDIQNEIRTIIHRHHNHHIILAGDFNRDILLKGRSSNGLITPPNQDDYEWARFTHNNGLTVVNNPTSFTRQGGHNYTSTSHIR